jgi:hypothetical protein
MKLKLLLLLSLFVLPILASASQFAECMIDGYDACPNALQWSCHRYKLYGRDFQTEGYFAYPLADAKRREKVEDELQQLIIQGVCPGPHGNQPPTSIDSKYIEAMEKSEGRVGKKLFKALKRIRF